MDYTYLYSTRIQNTFDEDQADILSVIRAELFNMESIEVQLINYYKGMPVSFKAKIIGIDKSALDLDIAPEQAVAMSAERYTFIRCNLFKNTILAKAQYLSIKHKAVSLRKLCYVEIMAERRRHIRLELEPPIKAVFYSPSGTVRGDLIELSMGGAIMSVTQPLDVVIGEETSLNIMVPDTEQNMTYNIKLPSIPVDILDGTKPRQVRLSITADDRVSDRVIAKYLYYRQVELIRELKEASELGLRAKTKTIKRLKTR
jgi:hypothetical protein